MVWILVGSLGCLDPGRSTIDAATKKLYIIIYIYYIQYISWYINHRYLYIIYLCCDQIRPTVGSQASPRLWSLGCWSKRRCSRPLCSAFGPWHHGCFGSHSCWRRCSTWYRSEDETDHTRMIIWVLCNYCVTWHVVVSNVLTMCNVLISWYVICKYTMICT